MLYPAVLAANEAYYYVYTNIALIRFPLLPGLFLSYCIMSARFYINKMLGSGKVENYQFYFPVDLIEYLTNNIINEKKSSEAQFELISNSSLCEAGHLTGVMYDLGDTIGCGALLGYKVPWRFAFEQATLQWRNTWLANKQQNDKHYYHGLAKL